MCKNKSGSSLIELVIYIACLAIFTGMLFQFLWQTQVTLGSHLKKYTDLAGVQIAADIVFRDLQYNQLVSNRKQAIKIATPQSSVNWYIKDGSLYRTEKKTAKTRANTSKAVAKVDQFILRRKKGKCIYFKITAQGYTTERWVHCRKDMVI